MRLATLTLAGLGLALTTLAPERAAAEPKIYPYAASANYCPAGLQPITIAGVMCCGVPNQAMSYQQVLQHPVARAHKPRRVRHYVPSARAHCPAGTKGCT